MNYKEYLLNEGSPSWIAKMSDEELKNYSKDHPGAKKVTLDYIRREEFARKNKYPGWVTGKKKEVTHYTDTAGNKYEPRRVDKSSGRDIDYVEKDGKKEEVFPVYTEFKGQKTLSHYQNDSGEKYEPKNVKKGSTGETFKVASYISKTNKEEEVTPVIKNVDKLEKHIKTDLIKNLGSDALNNGVEVIDKDKLTKAPYSKGTIAVFDKDDNYIGGFVGAQTQHTKQEQVRYRGRGRGSWASPNRKDLIERGSKFIYVAGIGDWESKTAEKDIGKSKRDLQNAQGLDSLANKAEKNSWGQSKVKEYYTNKLSTFKAEKGSEKIEKVKTAKKAAIEDAKKEIENYFTDESRESYSSDYGKLMQKLNKIKEIHNVIHYHGKAKSGSLETSDSERYMKGLEMFGK